MTAVSTLVIEWANKPESFLREMKAAHAAQPAEIRRVDARGLAASIILEDRARKRTPSKQPFIQPQQV